MARPRPKRPPRPRRARSDVEVWVDALALQVLVDDSNDVGLAIVDLRRKLLVETRRPGQRYPDHVGRLADMEESWAVEVSLNATGPGRWDATFQHLAPTATARNRQTSLDLDGAGEAADTGSDAALRMRLHRIERPWRENDLEHVTNFVHAELHGCAAIQVEGHPTPSSRYHEIDGATSRSGSLVRHSATLNGFDLGFDPDRRLALDADWDI